MSFIYVKRYGGFCNSLFLWQFAYRVAEINNCKVAVYKNHFPEFSFLDVPNTLLLDEEPKNILKIDSNNLKNNFILNIKEPITFTCEWNFNNFFSTKKEKPISKVKLKDKKLDSLIQQTCSNYIGVHLRRGDYKSIPEAFTPDSWYYDKCLNHKNNTFYLSTDGTQQDIQFLNCFDMKRYDLFTKGKNLNSINCHYMSENNPHKFPSSLSSIDSDLILIKVIDLFSLSYCKTIYGSESTFSITANILNGSETYYPNPKYYEVMSKFL